MIGEVADVAAGIAVAAVAEVEAIAGAAEATIIRAAVTITTVEDGENVDNFQDFSAFLFKNQAKNKFSEKKFENLMLLTLAFQKGFYLCT